MDTGVPRPTGGKQNPQIAAKYEGIYGVLLARAVAILRSPGMNDPVQAFFRLRNALQAAWAVVTLSTDGAAIDEADLDRRSAAFEQGPYAWSERGQRVESTNLGFAEARSRILLAVTHAYMPADCDAVLDLGCGWGHRLFELWVNGGPRDAAYWGGDRAPAALETIRRVAALFPGMKVAPFPFDFLRPDFTAVTGQPKSILIYTFLAVEQVFRLGSGLFDALVARFPDAVITCVHLEPVAFQAHPDDPAWDADRRYAEKHRYNIDLYAQVAAHPRLKILALDEGLMDEGGGNSLSALVWRHTPAHSGAQN